MTDKLTIDQLNGLARVQNKQFVASLLISVAVMMKKQGLTQLNITPEDLALLEPGEQLTPVPSMTGGLCFQFTKDEGAGVHPLAKRPVPKAMKKKVRRK